MHDHVIQAVIGSIEAYAESHELCHHGRQAATAEAWTVIASLSRTCKKLRRILAPRVLRTISICDTEAKQDRLPYQDSLEMKALTIAMGLATRANISYGAVKIPSPKAYCLSGAERIVERMCAVKSKLASGEGFVKKLNHFTVKARLKQTWREPTFGMLRKVAKLGTVSELHVDVVDESAKRLRMAEVQNALCQLEGSSVRELKFSYSLPTLHKSAPFTYPMARMAPLPTQLTDLKITLLFIIPESFEDYLRPLSVLETLALYNIQTPVAQSSRHAASFAAGIRHLTGLRSLSLWTQYGSGFEGPHWEAAIKQIVVGLRRAPKLDLLSVQYAVVNADLIDSIQLDSLELLHLAGAVWEREASVEEDDREVQRLSEAIVNVKCAKLKCVMISHGFRTESLEYEKAVKEKFGRSSFLEKRENVTDSG